MVLIKPARGKTAYLGPEASFSHQASTEALPQTEAVPLPSFKAILAVLQESESGSTESYDFAILPVENSTNGSVVQALDLLARCGLDPDTALYPDVEVVDEHYLEVHHCLFVSKVWAEQVLSTEELSSLAHRTRESRGIAADPDLDGHLDGRLSNGESSGNYLENILKKLDIQTLYTHPQVWGQCTNLLSALLPPGLVERVDLSSTSAAAAFVAGSSPKEATGIAAISSSLAGAKHGKELLCIARNIEDEPGANTTRFLILRNRQRPVVGSFEKSNPAAPVKSLWTFTIAHHIPGSLAIALAVFAKHNFNLSAIQSRPRPKVQSMQEQESRQEKNWKYVFFVECLHVSALADLDMNDTEYLGLLRGLREVTEKVSLLGKWKIGSP